MQQKVHRGKQQNNIKGLDVRNAVGGGNTLSSRTFLSNNDNRLKTSASSLIQCMLSLSNHFQ